MALLFNYQAMLQLDPATYEAWTPTLEEYEAMALDTAESLNPNIKLEATNKKLERYCKEVVFMNQYGDGLSANLYKYHSGKIAEYEELFRYGGGSL